MSSEITAARVQEGALVEELEDLSMPDIFCGKCLGKLYPVRLLHYECHCGMAHAFVTTYVEIDASKVGR